MHTDTSSRQSNNMSMSGDCSKDLKHSISFSRLFNYTLLTFDQFRNDFIATVSSSSTSLSLSPTSASAASLTFGAEEKTATIKEHTPDQILTLLLTDSHNQVFVRVYRQSSLLSPLVYSFVDNITDHFLNIEKVLLNVAPEHVIQADRASSVAATRYFILAIFLCTWSILILKPISRCGALLVVFISSWY